MYSDADCAWKERGGGHAQGSNLSARPAAIRVIVDDDRETSLLLVMLQELGELRVRLR
jgi:hypothetical protein